MLHTIFKKSDHRQRIFVPEDAVAEGAERYHLVLAVVDWVNFARNDACYVTDELPDAAVQTYCADYYFGQVCNGGHSQFLDNSDRDPVVMDFARAGLAAARLDEMLPGLDAVRADPHLPPDVLEPFDNLVYGIDRTYYGRMTEWLRPQVEALPPKAYAARVAAFTKRDKARERRYLDGQIRRMQACLEDRTRIGCDAVADLAGLTFRQLGVGSYVVTKDGHAVCWQMGVSRGAQKGVMYGMEVAGRFVLFAEPPAELPSDAAALDALISNRAAVGLDWIEDRRDAAVRTRMGAVTALLIERAPNLTPAEIGGLSIVRIGERPQNDDLVMLHHADINRVLGVAIADRGAVLRDFTNNSTLAHMSGGAITSALKAFDARHRVR